MTLRAAGTLLEGTPPSWVRKIEATLLLHAFARACGVEPPSLKGLDAQQALAAYRAFTSACLKMALEDKRLTRYLHIRLGEEAIRLGRAVRRATPLPSSYLSAEARWLYRGIGIGLAGSLPGELRFGPCPFAQRYTPQACALMSAFDEGFLRGLSGHEQAQLTFFCRLSEGALCCCAHFADVTSSKEEDDANS